MRTTPDDEVAEPYELTAMNSSSDGIGQGPGEVGDEHHRTLEHADQQRRHVPGVVGRDRGGQRGDLGLQHVLGDQRGGDLARGSRAPARDPDRPAPGRIASAEVRMVVNGSAAAVRSAPEGYRVARHASPKNFLVRARCSAGPNRRMAAPNFRRHVASLPSRDWSTSIPPERADRGRVAGSAGAGSTARRRGQPAGTARNVVPVRTASIAPGSRTAPVLLGAGGQRIQPEQVIGGQRLRSDGVGPGSQRTSPERDRMRGQRGQVHPATGLPRRRPAPSPPDSRGPPGLRPAVARSEPAPGSTPPPSTWSSSGSTSRRRRTLVNAGSKLCGSSQNARPVSRQAFSVSERRSSRNGRPHGRRHGVMPGDGARPGAAAEPEQHGLGLVVRGVGEQYQPGPCGPQGLIAGRPGRGLGSAPPVPTSTVSIRTVR